MQDLLQRCRCAAATPAEQPLCMSGACEGVLRSSAQCLSSVYLSLWPQLAACLQFNKEALEQQLPEEHGIQYKWMGQELGGLRKRDKSSEVNAGDTNHMHPLHKNTVGGQQNWL